MSGAATVVRPIPTPLAAAHPAAIILTGVLAGAVLATWLSEVSLGGSAELWIAYHQAVTPAYTRAVPPLGGLALIAALAVAGTSWWSVRDRRLVLAAVACLLVGLVVTVVVHFPINAEIATWQAIRSARGVGAAAGSVAGCPRRTHGLRGRRVRAPRGVLSTASDRAA
jgi:hypothetical protein